MDPTADFFNRLLPQRAGLVPRGVAATLRIDLERDDGGVDHWLVAFNDGALRVSMGERPADCTIRTSKALFDRMATGELNMVAATFRNQVLVEGELLVWGVFRKLLPGPPGARDPRDFFREKRAQQR